MKRLPPDWEEENRSKRLFEQCWLGPLCLLFWVIVIIAAFHGCTGNAKGAECTMEWDVNPVTDQVVSYRIYLGITLLAETPNTSATVQLPDAPCEVSLVAVNANGQSLPTTMKVACITDRDSIDLKAWRILRVYHREFLPGPRFYQTRIETP